jgi:hypothetical protein
MGKTYKDMQKTGKHVFDGPKVKDRKRFAPATKVEKPKKGKGSFERNKRIPEEAEEKKDCWDGYKKQGTKKKGGRTVNNCVKESVIKFVDATLDKNYAKASAYLKDAIQKKLQLRIQNEINKPLFTK